MKVEKKTLNTSDKTENEVDESVFPKGMIFFILGLSVLFIILILFRV